jgi:hypothetical protein
VALLLHVDEARADLLSVLEEEDVVHPVSADPGRTAASPRRRPRGPHGGDDRRPGAWSAGGPPRRGAQVGRYT